MNREEIEKQLSRIGSHSRGFCAVDLITRKCLLDLQESITYAMEGRDQDTREALKWVTAKAVRTALREYRNIINNL